MGKQRDKGIKWPVGCKQVSMCVCRSCSWAISPVEERWGEQGGSPVLQEVLSSDNELFHLRLCSGTAHQERSYFHPKVALMSCKDRNVSYFSLHFFFFFFGVSVQALSTAHKTEEFAFWFPYSCICGAKSLIGNSETKGIICVKPGTYRH